MRIIVLKWGESGNNVPKIMKNIKIIEDNQKNCPMNLIMHVILLLFFLVSRVPCPTDVIAHYLTIVLRLYTIKRFILLLK